MDEKILSLGICIVLLLAILSSGCLEGGKKEEKKSIDQLQTWRLPIIHLMIRDLSCQYL
ncbi:MAG: hypothetical protein AB1779_01115 [Candidatus Thermoplasmatota archaeon]